MHRISSDLRNEAAQGPVSTGLEDRPRRPQGAVSFCLWFFCCLAASSVVAVCWRLLQFENPPSGVLAEGISISGLVVEYIVAIDVTRVRFPADAFFALGGHSNSV